MPRSTRLKLIDDAMQETDSEIGWDPWVIYRIKRAGNNVKRGAQSEIHIAISDFDPMLPTSFVGMGKNKRLLHRLIPSLTIGDMNAARYRHAGKLSASSASCIPRGEEKGVKYRYGGLVASGAARVRDGLNPGRVNTPFSEPNASSPGNAPVKSIVLWVSVHRPVCYGRGLEVTERMEAARNRAGRQKRVIPLRSLRPSPQTPKPLWAGRVAVPLRVTMRGMALRVYQPQPLSESLHFLIHLGANHPMPIIRQKTIRETVWRTRDPTPRPSSAQEPRSPLYYGRPTRADCLCGACDQCQFSSSASVVGPMQFPTKLHTTQQQRLTQFAKKVPDTAFHSAS